MKSTKKTIILIVALIISSASFASKANLTIRGTINNCNSKFIYLYTVAENTFIDSAAIGNKGDFKIKTYIEEANIFKLTFKRDENYCFLLCSPDEEIDIVLAAGNINKPIKITGSKDTELLFASMEKVEYIQAKMDSVDQVYTQYSGTAQQDSIKRILIAEYSKYDLVKRKYIKEFVTENPASLACLFYLDDKNGLDIATNYDLYKKLDIELMKKAPNNIFVKELHKKVESEHKSAVGVYASEINLPTPSGDSIALSSLKGKYVLIDFWASWCVPCMREMPVMKEIYAKYQAKGFEIYAVSLDKKKADWVRAISTNQLNWTHVSDLKQWKCVAAADYGVRSIPSTVLLDPNGKIIAKGLRSHQIEEKLKEIFGE